MMTSPDTEFVRILGAATDDAGAPLPKAPTKALPEVLPILGLSDIVIFPGMVAPLLVDTPQSIRLIDDVVEGDRLLGLVLQRRAEVENPQAEDLWENGCAARVLKMLKFPDGTVRVLVEGLWRIRIKEYETQTPYLRAKIEVLKDIASDSVELTALARNAHRQFQEIIKLTPALSDQVKIAALNTEVPGNLTDLIAANLNLNLEERQYLLAINDVQERLLRLRPLMDRELEVLTLSSKIQNDVTSSMAKSQRDFFLREQIRAIQRELGETDPTVIEANNLREQIDQAQLPEEVKRVAFKELERLQQMSPAVAEYALTRNYLDWLINLPWHKATEDTLDLATATRILDEQHFGLEKVKERLLEFIAVIKLKKNLKGPILCLVGPPGVGKTSLGKSVADALGRKFARISLGGLRLEVLSLPSYTASEKLQIARRHLVPRQLQEHGLLRNQVKLPDATLRRLILDYTHEAGLRQLEREIASLARKAARKIISRNGQNGPLVISDKSLVDYLGQPRFISETAEKITEFGIAMGLSWAPAWGAKLFLAA